MKDYNEIATRIAKIILSPDSVKGLIHGALTVPMDFGYLVYGIFDTDSRYRHETMRIRMANAVIHDIFNREKINDALDMILHVFDKYLPESFTNKVYREASSSVAGRLITTGLSVKIVTTVMERIYFISASSKVSMLSTVLLLGGMTERSIKTSETLEHETPEIYQILRPGDYDLIYFLFKPAVQPFVDAIHVRVTQGPEAFGKILDLIEKLVNGRK